MPLAFANPHTQADLQQLKSLIGPLLADHFPSQLKPSMRLLNLACGRADETQILAESLVTHSDQLEITGIDIRNREIGEAKRRWKNLPLANSQFFTQDASQISHIRALDGPYDIIFIRHQNYWNGAEAWHRIYDNALQRLSDDGLLIITSYFDREHFEAVRAISATGGILSSSLRNPNSRIISDAPNKSVDRHVATFTRELRSRARLGG